MNAESNYDFLKISQSRPQREAEGLCFNSIRLTMMAWQVTLAYHSTQNEKLKAILFSSLDKMNIELFEMADKIFERQKGLGDIFYKECPNYYQNDWYDFFKDTENFSQTFSMNFIRLFFLHDILLQIDETNPNREKIKKASEKLRHAFKQINQILNDLEGLNDFGIAEAVHDSIVAAKSIDFGLSLEEADRLERKRWE